MQFALFGGARVAPEKGLEGAVCPFCRQPVIARCGEERVKHWAHKSVIDCDSWLEPETEWHRRWKNRFGDMQEQMHENGGTRHVADVKTTDGTIVEFRHNAISREGCATREAFFGKTMLWVVDCARNSRQAERLKENRYRLRTSSVIGYVMQSTREPEKCLPKVVLADVPSEAMLKGNSGSFLGTVEYSVKERPNGEITLRLRNFNPIPPIPPHRFSRECLWPLAPDQLAYFV